MLVPVNDSEWRKKKKRKKKKGGRTGLDQRGILGEGVEDLADDTTGKVVVEEEVGDRLLRGGFVMASLADRPEDDVLVALGIEDGLNDDS